MADDDKSRFGRRTALKGLGAAALTPLVGCDPEDPGADPTPAGPTPTLEDTIDTVVILMMENRSFDNYFGALTLEEGRTDIDGLTADMSNPHPDGSQIAAYPAEANCIADPPHGWSSCHRQFNDGAMDGFVTEHAARHGADEARRVMQYFGRDKLGPLYAMAEQHVLCEAWFGSVMSSTWPNRYYSHCGQNGGSHGNSLADPFPSIYPSLEAAGVTWKNYYGNAPFMVFLHDVAFDESFQPFEEFFWDAQIGNLPNVSIIEPIYGRNDDHPPAHPVAGQILIASVYEALKNSPQWERCALIVTYDEHGGFYDHVPPPLVADDRADEGFDQLGVRVPTVVCGPWTRQGHVSSAVFDHASILAFIERRFGIEPLTTRDANANDMYELFDMDRIAAADPLPAADLPVIEADEAEIYASECLVDIFRHEPLAITGQPELEAFLDGNPDIPARLDRRAETDALYRDFLARTQDQGVWRYKTRD